MKKMNAKLKVIFVIGILLLVMPFIGLPGTSKTFITVLFGAALMLLSYAISREKKSVVERVIDEASHIAEAFIEHDPQNNGKTEE